MLGNLKDDIFFLSVGFEFSLVVLNLVRAALAALHSNGCRSIIEGWVCCQWRDVIYIDFPLRQMDKSLLKKNIDFLSKKI